MPPELWDMLKAYGMAALPLANDAAALLAGLKIGDAYYVTSTGFLKRIL